MIRVVPNFYSLIWVLALAVIALSDRSPSVAATVQDTAPKSQVILARFSDVLVLKDAVILLHNEHGPAVCNDDFESYDLLAKGFPGRKKKIFRRIFRDPTSADHCLALATIGADFSGGAAIYRVNIRKPGSKPEIAWQTPKKAHPIDCYQNKAGEIFLASRQGMIFRIADDKSTELELSVPADARRSGIFREFRFAESSIGRTAIYSPKTDDPKRKQLRDIFVAEEDGFLRIEMNGKSIGAACFTNAHELLVTSNDKLLRIDTLTSAIYPHDVPPPTLQEQTLAPESIWRLKDGSIVGVFHQPYRSKWTYDVSQFDDGNFHQLAKLEKGRWELLDATKDRQLYHDQFVIHDDKTGTWFSDAGTGLLNLSYEGAFRRFDFRDGILVGKIDRLVAEENGHAWLVDTQRQITQRLNLAKMQTSESPHSKWARFFSRVRLSRDRHGNASLLSGENGGEIVAYSGAKATHIRLPKSKDFPATGPMQMSIDTVGNHWLFAERDGSVAIHHDDRWTVYRADDLADDPPAEQAFADALDGRFTGGSLPAGYCIGNDLDKYMINFGPDRQIVWRNTPGRIGYFDDKKWNSPISGREFQSRSVKSHPFFYDGDVVWVTNYNEFKTMPQSSWQSLKDADDQRPWQRAPFSTLPSSRQWRTYLRLDAQESSKIDQDQAVGFSGAARNGFVMTHGQLSVRNSTGNWNQLLLRKSPIFGLGSVAHRNRNFEGALLDNHGRVFLEIKTPWIYQYAIFEPEPIEVTSVDDDAIEITSPFESIAPKWSIDADKKTLLVRFRWSDRSWSAWQPSEERLNIGGGGKKGEYELNLQIASSEELKLVPALKFLIVINYDLDDFLEPLLVQLGSDSFGEREEATEKLLKIGRDAIPALRKIVDRQDAETAIRARTIIRSLQSQ